MTPRLRIAGVAWEVAGRSVLSGVTFDLRGGEVAVVMGRNGAGKSTLLDIVAGLRQPAGGDVRLDDRSLAAWDPRARARVIAHLPQIVRPDLPFLAGELVLMGRYPHTDRWFEGEEDRAAVERAMRRTDCWELRDRLLQTLSGGERQRVLLAACFAQEPALLLLDEPSTHLDIDQQMHCFSLLREEGKEPVIYAVGRKALGYYSFRQRDVRDSWTGFSERPTYEQAREIADVLVTAFMAGDDDEGDNPGDDGILGVDEIHIVFTEFKSMLSQSAVARVAVSPILST